ncbi:aurora kinase A and ninein-interacting protein [Hippoglossus stenolepis]|uniref:aurora kinase A and ninein-interacting protein n=1 Tax=Hippoglossus stenolepis TaxID=195615 RepID=UPI00159BFF37|nr:aurora kinase A and ninein-interacting protein [Hippoglossus stenolepis]
MKSSRPALQTTAQEECGVWLDTVQLKGKAKQKRLTRRPISKLLNPFAEGRGYSLAVALNFTQTKMEMPKTKQSSISAFFTRQPRVLKEKSASDEPNMDPVQFFSSASASRVSAPVASGTKRRRGTHIENWDSEPGVDQEWGSENLTQREATLWLEQGEAAQTPPQNSYCQSEEEQPEELNPPRSKRRFTDTSSLSDDSQPLPQAWSQDPLLTYSQYADSESYLTSQTNTKAENVNDCFLNSLQCEDDFGFRMDLKGKTSTQKSWKYLYSSQLEDEKENSRYLFSKSPRKRSPFSQIDPISNNERTEPKTPSPRKHIKDQPWNKVEDDESSISQFKWTKPSSSPFKKPARKQQSREADEDSLAMLFTQDSEGFRVIAHRGLQVRSPLKDPSNFSTGVVRTSSYKSLVEEDEEDEMLFTQDSQGNRVIKH